MQSNDNGCGPDVGFRGWPLGAARGRQGAAGTDYLTSGVYFSSPSCRGTWRLLELPVLFP